MWPVFAAAIAVTYLLRIAFVTLVPADRLPAAVQGGLTYVGPAAMAALATAAVIRGVDAGTGLAPQLGALAVAAAIAWWRGSVGLAVVGAVGAAWLIGLVL